VTDARAFTIFVQKYNNLRRTSVYYLLLFVKHTRVTSELAYTSILCGCALQSANREKNAIFYCIPIHGNNIFYKRYQTIVISDPFPNINE